MRIIYSLVFFCISFTLFSDEDLLNIEDWDDLFTEKGDNIEDEEESSVLDSLIHETGLSLTEVLSLQMGFAPGWDDPEQIDAMSFVPILKMSSTLITDVQISSHLRSYTKFNWIYPSFQMGITECFIDYDFTDNLSMRFGRHIVQWGISKNYNHTDVLDRIPDDFSTGGVKAEPLALRLSVPLGAGSLDFLSLTRKGYWDSAEAGEDAYPKLHDFGWGMKINYPVQNWDMTLFSYYHNDMFMRSAFNYKTTLFNTLEHYSELMVITDMTPESNDSERLWLSFNTAFFQDFFSDRLSLGVEYFYNGEELELTTISDTFLLHTGHNAVLLSSWNFQDIDLEAFFYGRFHWESETGILSPGIKWQFRNDLNIQSGVVYIYGVEDKGYRIIEGNPDPLNRPLIFFINFKFSGMWKQKF